MASRVERKRQLRAERQARAAAAAARERRTRRLRMLLASVVAAAVLVVAAVAVSTGSADNPGDATGPVDGTAEVKSLFAGVPQDGLTLGEPDAPVTLVEFADLQCPFCRDAALGSLPALVNDYVKQGKLRIEFRNFAILGPDSEKAARAVAAAAERGRAWQFVDLFYRNQGEERSGYVTDDFIRRIAGGVEGLDPEAVVRASNDTSSVETIDAAHADAQKFGIESTPSFLIGRTGQALRPLPLTAPDDPSAFRQAIDATIGRS